MSDPIVGKLMTVGEFADMMERMQKAKDAGKTYQEWSAEELSDEEESVQGR